MTKKWTIPFFKGQVAFGYCGNSKLEELGGYDKANDSLWEEKPSDYTFEASMRFVGINASSASGRQFIFRDDGGFEYQMLPGSFIKAMQEAVKGVVTGVFGFEKIGSTIGVKLLMNKGN
jgi:hypothetical protein